MSGKVDSKPKAAPSRPASKAPSRKSESAPAKDKSVEGKVAPKDRADISREASQKESKPGDNSKQISALQDNFAEKPAASKGRSLSDDRSVSGGENCLDRAASQAKNDDQALFLKDGQNKDGNNAGHVVLQRDGRIVDPNTPDKNYENFEAYKAANPQYNEILGQTSGENLKRIVDAQSPAEREQAIQQAGLENIKNEKFADLGATGQTRVQNTPNPAYPDPTVTTERKSVPDAASAQLDAFNSATANVSQHDRKLAGYLNRAGEALSPEQKAAMVAQHRQDNADYANQTTARDDIGKLFQPPQDWLKGVVDNPASRGEAAKLFDLCRAASEGQGASAMLDWAKDQNFDRLRDTIPNFDERWANEVLGPALPHAVRQLTEQGAIGSAVEGTAKIKGYFDNLKGPAEAFAAGPGIDMLAAHVDGNQAEYKRLEALLDDPEFKSSGLQGLKKGMTVAGMALGSMSAVQNGREEKYLAMTADILGTAKDGIGLAAEYSSVFGSSAKTVGSRFVPGLGAVASTMSAVSNFQEFADDKSVGKLLQGFGDVIQAGGSLAEMTPFAPLGALTVGLGAAMSGVGAVVAAVEDNGRLNKETTSLLSRTAQGNPGLFPRGMDAGSVLNAQAGDLRSYGMSTDQLQSFATKYPDVASSREHLEGIARLTKTLNPSVGLEGMTGRLKDNVPADKWDILMYGLDDARPLSRQDMLDLLEASSPGLSDKVLAYNGT